MNGPTWPLGGRTAHDGTRYTGNAPTHGTEAHTGAERMHASAWLVIGTAVGVAMAGALGVLLVIMGMIYLAGCALFG